MKISNKRELLQIEFNHLPDTEFEEFMNLYKKCTLKIYLLMNDIAFSSERIFQKEYKASYDN